MQITPPEDVLVCPPDEPAEVRALHDRLGKALKAQDLPAAQGIAADLLDTLAGLGREPNAKTRWLLEFVIVLS